MELADASSSFFSHGQHTHKIPMLLHQDNRKRLCQRLRDAKVPAGCVVLLEGGRSSDIQRYSTDTDHSVFRQESYFQWLFGAGEADFFGAVDVDTGKAIIFIPRLPDAYLVWSGQIHPPEHYRKLLAVEEAFYTDEIVATLKQKNASLLLTLNGKNTDSGSFTREATFDGIDQFKVDNKILHPEITECRVFKNDYELELLRYCNKISSDAHKKLMKVVRPGCYEYQAESVFSQYCYSHGGMRHVGYTCICASGHNGSVLHYGHAGEPNAKLIQDGDICLFDLGGEYYGYTADITCSFPANGKFTPAQRLIYEAVLASNRAVMSAAKPGVSWADMHRLSERVLLQHLRDGGLLQGDVEEMMKVHLGAVFMPHGLGHMMGLDVHDVGGYPQGVERVNEPGIKNLRTARTLKERMVLTIEPGCYFINKLLDDAFANPEQSKFLVKDKINACRGLGGVRIEDDVVVTSSGVENLTQVPRTVEEIEALMAEGRKEFPNINGFV
jgi:Xaa-Pro dipeptidase